MTDTTLDRSPYWFSLIVPVFNQESYLDCAVQSILKQDLLPRWSRTAAAAYGTDCVELILVDDGSTDRSGEICDRYSSEFDWIKVVHQPNRGVSSARNTGLALACGEWVGFLDPDDYYSANTLNSVYSFIQSNPFGLFDVATIPITIIDQRNSRDNKIVTAAKNLFGFRHSDYHGNRRFQSISRVIDLDTEPTSYTKQSAGNFFRRTAIGSNLFDEALIVGEDAEFVNRILLKNRQLGAVSPPTYWYRKHHSDTNALSRSLSDRRAFGDYVEHALLRLLSSAECQLGRVPRFLQHLVWDEIQWRITRPPHQNPTGNDLSDYREKIVAALQYIDDEVLISAPGTNKDFAVEHRLHLISLKSGLPLRGELNTSDITYSYPGGSHQQSESTCQIDLVTINSTGLTIEGFGRYFDLQSNPEMLLTAADREYASEDPPLVPNDGKLFALEEQVCYARRFVFHVPLEDLQALTQTSAVGFRVSLRIGITTVNYSDLKFGRRSQIASDYSKQFLAAGGFIISSANGIVVVELSSPHKVFRREIAFTRQLLTSRKITDASAAIIRLAVRIVRAAKRRPWWILMDRTDLAGDNGEALFRHLHDLRFRDARVFFSVNKSSPDFAALKRYGAVINRASLRYLFLFLVADKMISSHIDVPFQDPLARLAPPFRDLCTDKNYVFLQHGVIIHDLSEWLNRYQKNISLFVASANPEYDSILSGPYGYTENEVKLTGMPRWDLLHSQWSGNKWIVIAPTWRRGLTNHFGPSKADFYTSSYASAWTELLSDPSLVVPLQQHGYQLCVKPHPAMNEFASFFTDIPGVEFLGDMPYREIFHRAAIMVTDFSSVVSDFALLRRPVIFYDFDEPERDTVPGYHIYEEDAFDFTRLGEKHSSRATLVEAIIRLIDNDLAIEPRVADFLNGFFPVPATGNCQRVLDEILAQDAELRPSSSTRSRG